MLPDSRRGGANAPRQGEAAGEAAGEGGGDGGGLAVGDGAVRFRPDLEGAGCLVEPDRSPLHGVGAGTICRLALEAPHATARDLVVPDYLRPPDAARSRKS